jgi:hypothetical protein
MSIFIQPRNLPLVFEISGDDPPADLESVTAAVRFFIEERYVFQVLIHNTEAGEVENHVLVNFAAFSDFNIRSTDPRTDEDWDGRLIYTSKLVDLLGTALTEIAERNVADEEDD